MSLSHIWMPQNQLWATMTQPHLLDVKHWTLSDLTWRLLAPHWPKAWKSILVGFELQTFWFRVDKLPIAPLSQNYKMVRIHFRYFLKIYIRGSQSSKSFKKAILHIISYLARHCTKIIFDIQNSFASNDFI